MSLNKTLDEEEEQNKKKEPPSRCLYQIIKMALPPELKHSSGNCDKCVYDPKKNKKCRGYHPAKIGYISVKEN